MKNILIISGHPDLKISLSNKTILDEVAKNCPQAEIRKLDELYPDYNFDVKAEQAALEKADVIIFQYPTHWYNVPGILKLYIDKVMEHGWAYGSKGTALKGKAFIASTTVGAPENLYSAEGAMKHTVDEFYFGLQQYAALCGMDFKGFIYSCGMMYVPGITTDAQKAALIDKAKAHAEKILDCLKSM
ncbi:MAG: NAD(P)H-dependent oxidoreductase [Selenomonadaceae bacterium]|nr:NAD(P)H-dependent oxidoreductase [Selenomonadaceae bacterium]